MEDRQKWKIDKSGKNTVGRCRGRCYTLYLLYGKSSAGDFDAATFAEVVGEEIGVDRGRHEDHLQIRSQRQHVAQDEEEEVRLLRPLVNLVHDHVSNACKRVRGKWGKKRRRRRGEEEMAGEEEEAEGGKRK